MEDEELDSRAGPWFLNLSARASFASTQGKATEGLEEEEEEDGGGQAGALGSFCWLKFLD